MNNEVFCEKCGWKGLKDDLLNIPFDKEDDEILFCPSCKGYKNIKQACSETNCLDHRPTQ